MIAGQMRMIAAPPVSSPSSSSSFSSSPSSPSSSSSIAAFSSVLFAPFSGTRARSSLVPSSPRPLHLLSLRERPAFVRALASIRTIPSRPTPPLSPRCFGNGLGLLSATQFAVSSFSSPSAKTMSHAGHAGRSSAWQKMHLNEEERGVFSARVSAGDWEMRTALQGESVMVARVLPAVGESMGEGVRALREGGVVGVPTDTLYGLAADARNGEAVARIFRMKGRGQSKPLAVCLADECQVADVAAIEHLPRGLLSALLPGPVTLVLPHSPATRVHQSVTGGGKSVGVRVPEADFIRGLVRALGSPLALTSANASQAQSTLSVHEFKSLWSHCAYVFDGGILPGGRDGSTVVDLCSPGIFRIIRPGGAYGQTVRVLQKYDLIDEGSGEVLRGCGPMK